MKGVITHVSYLNRRTTCNTALKNTPKTREMAPSHTSILAICAELFRAFRRFPTTTGQLSVDLLDDSLLKLSFIGCLHGLMVVEVL